MYPKFTSLPCCQVRQTNVPAIKYTWIAVHEPMRPLKMLIYALQSSNVQTCVRSFILLTIESSLKNLKERQEKQNVSKEKKRNKRLLRPHELYSNVFDAKIQISFKMKLEITKELAT